MRYPHLYLIHLQYLGFRYHGWQIQPDVKTLQYMINRTITYVLGHSRFKTIGSSRTDAMVSANHTIFELFLKEDIEADSFLQLFNENLPADIRATHIETTTPDFNIIQSPKIKEYHYLFACGQKAHPFSAPLMATFPDKLAISLMQKGAKLFEGKHDFIYYCRKPSPQTKTEREILLSQIEENTLYQANFFPSPSYLYRIQSKGFLRNQVRIMMGSLLLLGKGELSLEQIQATLQNPQVNKQPFLAPASGLILHRMDYL